MFLSDDVRCSLISVHSSLSLHSSSDMAYHSLSACSDQHVIDVMYVQAIRAYSKALRLCPSNSTAACCLAEVLLGLGRVEEAVQW